ncbi:MAG: NUDIX hydrolase, partial [Mariprofundus sp.]|nr:NUDIX hydrolase [Mariprofundus sp.]
KRFIKAINGLPAASGCVLIVAGGAGIEALLHYLGVISDAGEENLRPTSLAVLSCDSDWSDIMPGAVRLERCIHAADLPRQFPYPDVRGDQRRDRPAYYYRQSAVIPYRLKHQRIEIMLITSSGNKHWVVPKGIHEPGLSARDSAAKEALEEAGIEGIVGAKALGKYDHAKWGNLCQVKVFSMHVGHVLNKKKWQESHRKRQWCSLKKARALLDQQALISMLDTLAGKIAPSAN